MLYITNQDLYLVAVLCVIYKYITNQEILFHVCKLEKFLGCPFIKHLLKRYILIVTVY